jgi:hypothetical protein
MWTSINFSEGCQALVGFQNCFCGDTDKSRSSDIVEKRKVFVRLLFTIVIRKYEYIARPDVWDVFPVAY